MKKFVVGMDLGFAHTGYVFATVDTLEIFRAGCIDNPPLKNRASGSYVADEDVLRCEYMAQEISKIFDEKPSLMAIEIPTGGSKSSRAARCMALITGVIATLNVIHDVPVLWVQPSDTKALVPQEVAKLYPKATKPQVQHIVKDRFPELNPEEYTVGHFEHIADAAGALMVTKDTALMKMLRSNNGDRSNG